MVPGGDSSRSTRRPYGVRGCLRLAHDRIELLTEMMLLRHEDPTNGWFADATKALAGVTAAQAAWVPGPGMNSIWQLVNHLTFWTQFVTRRLAGELPTGRHIDNDTTFGDPGNPADAEGWTLAVQRLHEAYGELGSVLALQADADLERPLNSRQTRASAMTSGVVMHDAYHLGQIVVLRKLQGSWS